MASNYNKSEKKSNNTYGPSYYNTRTMEKLSVLYWDTSVGLTISKIKENSNGMFDEDENNSLRITLKPYTLGNFVSECKEVYDLIKKGQSFDNVSVSCGSDGTSLIEISNGSNIDREPGIYFVIYKNLKDNRTTDTYMAYKFSSRDVVTGYNRKTGTGSVKSVETQEFKEFIKTIEDFNSSMNMAMAHAYKEATKYQTSNTNRVLAMMCSSMGIELTNGKSYNKSNTKRENMFSNKNSNPKEIEFDDTGYTESEININLDV